MKRSVDIVVKAHDQASKKFQKMGNQTGFLTRNLGKLKAAAAAYIGLRLVKAIASQTMEMLKLMDQTAKFADIIGISTEALLRLRYAAEISGISVEALDKSFAIMTRRIGEAARGSGEAARGIEMMGVSAQKLIAMRPEQLFEEIAEAIKKQKTPAEQAALAYYMFGRQGMNLVKMLRLGKDELKELGDEAERTGGVFSRETAAKAEEANDAMTRWRWAVRGLKQELAIGLAPAIEATADGLSELNKTLWEYKSFLGFPLLGELTEARTKLREEVEISNAVDMVAVEEQIKLQEAIGKLNDKLREQINTYGMASREIAIYKLRMQGATEEQLKQAIAGSKFLDAMDRQKEAFDKQSKSAEKFRETLQGLTKELSILQGTATELDWQKFEWTKMFGSERAGILADMSRKIAASQAGPRPGVEAIESRFLSRVPGQEPIKETAKHTKKIAELAQDEKRRDEQLIDIVQGLADRGLVLQPANLGGV